jgi:hypothetical protein
VDLPPDEATLYENVLSTVLQVDRTERDIAPPAIALRASPMELHETKTLDVISIELKRRSMAPPELPNDAVPLNNTLNNFIWDPVLFKPPPPAAFACVSVTVLERMVSLQDSANM